MPEPAPPPPPEERDSPHARTLAGEAGRSKKSTPPAAFEPVLTPAFVRVLVGNFLFFMTFATFFLLPIYIHELGGDDQTVGLVMGVSGIASLVGIFAVAALIDRLGARFFSRVGFVCMTLVALGFSHVGELGAEFFALRIIQGLAFACGFNGNSTLAATLAPASRRATALGFFGISTLTTHALAPALGEQLAGLIGFPSLFAMAAVFSAIGCVVTWSLTEPTRGTRRERKSPLSLTTPLVATMAATAFCGVSFGSVMTFIPTFVVAAKLGPVATFFLSYASAAITSRFFVGSLVDRVGHFRIILPGMVALSLAIAALAVVDSTLQLIAVGLWFGLAQGVVFPTLNAWTVGLGTLEQIGRIQSLFNGVFNVGITLEAFLFGPIVHHFGHRPMFVAAGAASLFGAGLFSVAQAAFARLPAGQTATSDLEPPAPGPELSD